MAVSGLMAVHYGRMRVGIRFEPVRDENLQSNGFVDFAAALDSRIREMVEIHSILVQNSLQIFNMNELEIDETKNAIER